MKKISCVFFTVLILCNTFILGVGALSLEIADIPETKYVYIDDIPENAWYADARKFTQEEGIMRPTLISTVEREEEEEDGSMYKYYEKSFDFSGNRSITRAEVSTLNCINLHPVPHSLTYPTAFGIPPRHSGHTKTVSSTVWVTTASPLTVPSPVRNSLRCSTATRTTSRLTPPRELTIPSLLTANPFPTGRMTLCRGQLPRDL